MNECDGDAVGGVLGPSAYPSFPILPSLSPYHPIPYPTPLPTAFVWIGAAVEIPDLVASVRFTPNPKPSLSRCLCAVCRRAVISDESVDMAQCSRFLSLPISLIQP